MEIIIYIVVGIVIIVAVKIGITFDINEWLKSKRDTQRVKFQNMCPHVNLRKHGDQCIVGSLVVRPSGTRDWHCQQCGRFFHAGMSKDEVEYWANNPVELIKQNKSINKQAKKMGII